jgi:hypothetical protein
MLVDLFYVYLIWILSPFHVQGLSRQLYGSTYQGRQKREQMSTYHDRLSLIFVLYEVVFVISSICDLDLCYFYFQILKLQFLFSDFSFTISVFRFMILIFRFMILIFRFTFSIFKFIFSNLYFTNI